jgi:hypothetical protein
MLSANSGEKKGKNMQGRARTAVGIVAVTVVGCGGDGGAGSAGSPGSGTAYSFVSPTSGVTRIYAEAVVDNSDNTINIGYSDSTTSVNSNGSYVADVQSTTGNSAIVNGTNYAITDENESYDDSGQEVSYTFTASTGVLVSCTYDPHANGPDFPVQVGQTWQIEYTLSCDDGSTTISYMQQGSVVDVESLTVPAGTFTALKFQSTLSWTDADGAARNETITAWRDTKTLYTLKQQIAITVSGTLPVNGYAVNRTIELQSVSSTS